MTITQEKTGDLTATVKIELEQADYQEQVDKILKDYQRKANIPGFRPGKVPFGMIRKLYGKAIAAEEINKILSDSITSYVSEQKLDIIGHPLPNHEKNKTLDLDNDTNFEFFFDLGLTPQFNLALNNKLKIKHYNIKVDDTLVDNYLKDIRRKHGNFINPDISESNDMMFGGFAELDEEGQLKENGVKNNSYLYLEHIPDEESKNRLVGLKIDDTTDLDLTKITKGETEIAYILGKKKEELEGIGSKFRFTVISISRVEPAELNEEFFAKVYRNGDVKTEEELRSRIASDALVGFEKEARKRFMSDVGDILIAQSNISLPDEFLKRFFYETSKDEDVTQEQVEADYPRYIDVLKWQLIENKIIRDNNINVTEEDMRDYIKGFFRNDLQQQHDHDHENCDDPEHNHDQDRDTHDKRLDEIASSILKNAEEAKKINDKLFDDKLYDQLLSVMAVEQVDITYEEFAKLNLKPNN